MHLQWSKHEITKTWVSKAFWFKNRCRPPCQYNSNNLIPFLSSTLTEFLVRQIRTVIIEAHSFIQGLWLFAKHIKINLLTCYRFVATSLCQTEEHHFQLKLTLYKDRGFCTKNLHEPDIRNFTYRNIVETLHYLCSLFNGHGTIQTDIQIPDTKTGRE